MNLRLVDTEDSLRSFLCQIRPYVHKHEKFYVDTEGHKLGRFGTLDLIQVYTPAIEEIFIVDVFILQHKAFDISYRKLSLKTLFESPSLSKVFFDVRNDSDALFSHFHISLQGVVDLQLMEYFQSKRTDRALLGLRACISQHSQLEPGVMRKWTEVKEVVAALHSDSAVDHQVPISQQRPLPTLLLEYATGDVKYMPLLFDMYRKNLSNRAWTIVKVESRKRIDGSLKPQYDPHGKNKWKGPYRHFKQTSPKPTTHLPKSPPVASEAAETKTLSKNASRSNHRQKPRRKQENRVSDAQGVSRPADVLAITRELQNTSIDDSHTPPSYDDSNVISSMYTLRHQPVTFVKEGHAPNHEKRKRAKNPKAYQEVQNHLSEDLDWALCDKDCGWCGHCYGKLDMDV